MTTEQDKRACPRFPEGFEVTYSLLIDSSHTPILFEDSKTLDISQHGARILIHEQIPVDTLIQLCIRLPSLRSPILMMAKARWCQPREDLLEVGIRFIGNLPSNLESLLVRMHSTRGLS